ncbi:MAG: hypothetical protein HY286_15320 [Planctomycetes bacterium]|nr:hypothetical protein [Planctomycetota bacterium]
MADEYIGFEEALRRLKLEDAQLKRLISENEIKAYRDSGSMKLKKDDVDRLRERLTGGGGQTEELVFEDDEASNDPGMATVALSEQPTMTERTAQKKTSATPRTTVGSTAKKPADRPISLPPARRKKEIPVETGGEPGWVKGLLVAALIVMVVSIFTAFDAVKGSAGAISSALPGVLNK